MANLRAAAGLREPHIARMTDAQLGERGMLCAVHLHVQAEEALHEALWRGRRGSTAAAVDRGPALYRSNGGGGRRQPHLARQLWVGRLLRCTAQICPVDGVEDFSQDLFTDTPFELPILGCTHHHCFLCSPKDRLECIWARRLT